MKRMGTSVLLIIVGAFSSIPLAQAKEVKLCTGYTMLADGWNALGEKVEELEAAGISSAEQEEIGQAVRALSDTTNDIIQILANGNVRERASGEIVESQFNALKKAADKDVVKKIKGIVKSVDNLAEFCHQVVK